MVALSLLIALVSLGISGYLLTRPAIAANCNSEGAWSVLPKTTDLPAGWSLNTTTPGFVTQFEAGANLAGPEGLNANLLITCVEGDMNGFLNAMVSSQYSDGTKTPVSMGAVGESSTAFRPNNSSGVSYTVLWVRRSFVATLTVNGVTPPIKVTDVQALAQALDVVMTH